MKCQIHLDSKFLLAVSYEYERIKGEGNIYRQVKNPAKRVGILQNLIKLVGESVPKTPKQNGIHPRAKHGAFCNGLVNEVILFHCL